MDRRRRPFLPFAIAALAFAVPALADDNPVPWAGHWPFEIAADPAFKDLAGDAFADRVEPLLETGPKAQAVGGRWLVVEGCRSHLCGFAGAFVVIDMETGGMKAWSTMDGAAGVRPHANAGWGGTNLPREIAARLEAWRSRLRAKAP